MATKPDPKALSQAELDELLDELARTGREDSAEFRAAYAEWERRKDQP